MIQSSSFSQHLKAGSVGTFTCSKFDTKKKMSLGREAALTDDWAHVLQRVELTVFNFEV